MKIKNHKGFTLVELLIAILVVGILALLVVPSIIKYVGVSKENVCKHNREEVLTSYQREALLDTSITLDDVIENKNSKYFSSKVRCPGSGMYVATLSYLGDRAPQVTCTEHSDSATKVNAVTKWTLQRLAGMTAAERREFLGITDNNVTNDTIRKKIFELLGGSYESLEKEIQDSMSGPGKDKDLYVQAMITKQDGDAFKYVLYANEYPDLNGGMRWRADTVFDPNSGTWYEYTGTGTYQLASKTYDQVINDLKDANSWKPLN